MIENKIGGLDFLSIPEDKNSKEDIYKQDILNLEDNINQEKLEELLSSLKGNEGFKKFSDVWNSFSDKDKLDVYNDGSYAFDIDGGLKRNLKFLNPIKSPIRSPLIRFFQKDSIKKQITKDSFFIISAAVRVFIHLGVLNKPKDLKQEVLIKNIESDEKNLNTKINILEKAAMFIPELKPALPIIKQIKPIIKVSSSVGKDVMLKSNQAS